MELVNVYLDGSQMRRHWNNIEHGKRSAHIRNLIDSADKLEVENAWIKNMIEELLMTIDALDEDTRGKFVDCTDTEELIDAMRRLVNGN